MHACGRKRACGSTCRRGVGMHTWRSTPSTRKMSSTRASTAYRSGGPADVHAGLPAGSAPSATSDLLCTDAPAPDGALLCLIAALPLPAPFVGECARSRCCPRGMLKGVHGQYPARGSAGATGGARWRIDDCALGCTATARAPRLRPSRASPLLQNAWMCMLVFVVPVRVRGAVPCPLRRRCSERALLERHGE